MSEYRMRLLLIAFVIIIFFLPTSLHSVYKPAGFFLLMSIFLALLENPMLLIIEFNIFTFLYLLITNLFLLTSNGRGLRMFYRIGIVLLLIWNWCFVLITKPSIDFIALWMNPLLISIAGLIEFYIITAKQNILVQ